MPNVLTAVGVNGKHVGHAQPVADSVAGSPFTSGASTAATPVLRGLAMIMVTTQPIHVRFDKDNAVAADVSDFLLPPNQLFMIPCDGHVMSFVQETAAAQIYVAIAREVG